MPNYNDLDTNKIVMTEQLEKSLAIMRKLRDPDGGCPWDLKQNFRSITTHTLEEAYEVTDAIERDDMAALKDELGDLVFQVIFYSQLAAEEGLFDFESVLEGLNDKLIRRHPHVFSENTDASIEEVNAAWEQQKKNERAAKAQHENRQASVLDDVPVGLPGLSRAAKLQKRASREGFDWRSVDGAMDKVREEIKELADARTSSEQEHELGDVLFSAVNVSRFLKIDPERALRYANARFSRRFEWIEQALDKENCTIADCSEEKLEALWQEAKQHTSGAT